MTLKISINIVVISIMNSQTCIRIPKKDKTFSPASTRDIGIHYMEISHTKSENKIDFIKVDTGQFCFREGNDIWMVTFNQSFEGSHYSRVGLPLTVQR